MCVTFCVLATPLTLKRISSILRIKHYPRVSIDLKKGKVRFYLEAFNIANITKSTVFLVYELTLTFGNPYMRLISYMYAVCTY